VRIRTVLFAGYFKADSFFGVTWIVPDDIGIQWAHKFIFRLPLCVCASMVCVVPCPRIDNFKESQPELCLIPAFSEITHFITCRVFIVICQGEMLGVLWQRLLQGAATTCLHLHVTCARSGYCNLTLFAHHWNTQLSDTRNDCTVLQMTTARLLI
jgi:hypothetical protein